MKDPFDQAFSGQHNLFNKLRETYPEYKDNINSCKFMVAVWFPKYTKEEIQNTDFGPNVVKEIIMTREALLYKDETISQVKALMERMIKFILYVNMKKNLSKMVLVINIHCPILML